MAGKLMEAAGRKGYSASEICRLINKQGIRLNVDQLILALRDNDIYSAKKDAIRRDAAKIIDALPDLSGEAENFAKRARGYGTTAKAIWEKYNETHDDKYSYGAFMCAVMRRSYPFEIKIAKEADKILAEIAAEYDG